MRLVQHERYIFRDRVAFRFLQEVVDKQVSEYIAEACELQRCNEVGLLKDTRHTEVSHPVDAS